MEEEGQRSPSRAFLRRLGVLCVSHRCVLVMHHSDPLYPVWLFMRQALLDAVPAILQNQMGYTCGQAATKVLEEMQTKLHFGDAAAQTALLLSQTEKIRDLEEELARSTAR